MSENESQPIGRVLGTESSTPLDWWVAIEPDQFLQLDDVVLVRTDVPGAGELRISGVVDQVRAQHEGSRFESEWEACDYKARDHCFRHGFTPLDHLPCYVHYKQTEGERLSGPSQVQTGGRY